MEQVPGNPNTQQRELLSGNSYVELEKQVIELTGEDRLTWLNDMLSQKLDELVPGQSAEALWLDVNGRILRDFHVICLEQSVLLITFSDGVDQLLTQLQRLVFRAKVQIELKENYKVFGTFKQGLPDAVAIWQDPWPRVAPGGWRYGEAIGEPWDYFESVAVTEPAAIKRLANVPS